MSKHYDLHLEKAREFYDDGNYEAARAASEHALSVAQSDEGIEAKIMLALSLRKLEFEDESFRMLGDLIASTTDPEAMSEYALMRAERGLCDELCRDYAEKSIESAPDLASGYMALFWYYASQMMYAKSLQNLKRGLHRGADFPESRVFEMVRSWCQEACDRADYSGACELSAMTADLFGSADFYILHARLCELSNDPRTAVQYYKKTLVFLRPGQMRIEILEAIARLAI